MKAKLVKENIGFERNIDPKGSMNLGKSRIAKEMLEKRYPKLKPGTPGGQLYDYKFISLDNIELFFTDWYRENIKEWMKQNNKTIEETFPLKIINRYSFSCGITPAKVAFPALVNDFLRTGTFKQAQFFKGFKLKILFPDLILLQNMTIISQSVIYWSNPKIYFIPLRTTKKI